VAPENKEIKDAASNKENIEINIEDT